jgi:cytochrome c biogenesis protein CcmG/thiol:disulfide interchange protein DsbE
MKQKLALPLLMGLVLAFLLTRPGQGGGSLYTKVNGPAPSWVLKDLEGRSVSSTNFQGRVLLINFWATWCPPCRKEIPDFVKFTHENDTNRVVILGLSVDEGGVDVVKPFVGSYKINYPVLMADQSVTDAFGGVAGFPTTFVIDAKGNLVSRHLGMFSEADFKRYVLPLLENKP